MNTHRVGVDGENAACKYLESLEYVIKERNWRTRRGEIDIIAVDGDTLVFVEVKFFTKTPIEDLSRAVNLQKQHKVVETSKCFLVTHREFSSMYVRYDVILVGADAAVSSHIKSAFVESV